MASKEDAPASSDVMMASPDSPMSSSKMQPGLLAGSPGIKTRIKQPRLSTDYDKCIKCQMAKKHEKLQIGLESSVSKFIKCAKSRKDSVYYRLLPDLDNGTLPGETVKWHKSCYSSYTSAVNVSYKWRMENSEETKKNTHSGTRSSESIINWSLCLICQKVKYKGERALTQIVTTQVYDTLMNAAKLKYDDIMVGRILGEDLIAVEAKYHRGCYQRYTVCVSSCKTSGDGHVRVAPYDAAFTGFLEEIDHKLLNEGRAYDMGTLLALYKEHLAVAGVDDEAIQHYKMQNLKRRLQNKYGNSIAFHPQYERNKTELVYSSSLELGNIINVVSALKNMLSETSEESDMINVTDTCSQILYHAAVILRSIISDAKGIQTHPLQISDLSLEAARNIVPPKLQQFLRWLLQSSRSFDSDLTPIQDELDLDEAGLEEQVIRNALAIGQDIIQCNSGGRKKMPKNVGLALAVHNIVRGKEIITMLNHHGHSISYWECEQIEVTWAEEILEQFGSDNGYYKAVVPTNIVPGSFVHAAADNSDFAQDDLHGKSTINVMSIAFYQGAFPLEVEKLVPHTRKPATKHRAVQFTETKLYHIEMIKKPFLSFFKFVEPEFFRHCADERNKLVGLNKAWIFTRNTSTKLFHIEVEKQQNYQVPGWSGFHAIITTHQSQLTRIGFPPMIPAPVKELDTVYTCMKTISNAFQDLGHNYAVVTFDEGIYHDAKTVQWCVKPELDNIVVRLGGFHRAKNFIGLIGKRMSESGVEDIWSESDIYGPNVCTKILNGVHYNRAVRAHKVTAEALERIRWDSFCDWVQNEGFNLEENVAVLPDMRQKLISEFAKGSKYVTEHRESIRELTVKMGKELQKLDEIYNQFRSMGRECSQTFQFWDEYLDMVWLLLYFIHGDRDSNWNLHLETFVDMLPYDRAFDHLNYFKWGTVYVADMKMLQVSAPPVYDAFTRNRLHAIVRSESSNFNAVSPDMALEQTQNRDAKTKGGIGGFAGVEEYRNRWTLTAHIRAAATAAFKDMSGLKGGDSFHKDLGTRRIEKDENDIQAMMACIAEKMMNPFDITKYDGEQMPLLNIATGSVVPMDIALSLLSARDEGKKAMDIFLEERLISGKVSFWEPIKKMQIKTFASLNKPLQLTKEKQTVKSLNVDREVFSRLLVVSKTRDIDLKEVQTYELTPVPLSLANMDGSLRKTNKSVLLKELELDGHASINLPPAPSSYKSAYIIDLLALIQMMCKGKKKTFGDLSDALATSVMSKFQFAEEVHVVPDRYDQPDSIKSGERMRRSKWRPIQIKIQNRETKLPASLKRYLSSSKNKSDLLSFLLTDWMERLPQQLQEGQTLILASQEGKATCVSSNTCSEVPSLGSDHEEADSRMFVHCGYFVNANKHSEKRIIIFSPDTDVAVLCWHHFIGLGISELWFHTGTGRKRRFIPVHDSVFEVGEEACELLPASHVMTGCDATSGLANIGKKKAWSVMTKNSGLLGPLKNLGNDSAYISPETMTTALNYIGLLYGENTCDLNTLRYKLFTKKGLASLKLPPTEDSAKEHIKRANFQCFIWRHAKEAYLNLPTPVGNGWARNKGGILIPQLMNKPSAPESINELVVCNCHKGCRGRCSCRSLELPCTPACSCESDCNNNEQMVTADDSDDDI